MVEPLRYNLAAQGIDTRNGFLSTKELIDHQRVMGAMLLFYTSDGWVWTMKDEHKPENVGVLFTQSYPTSEFRFNTIAGCRIGPESVTATLVNEMTEELYQDIHPNIEFYLRQFASQFNFSRLSDYPFVVNQIKGKKEMNRIGVTVVGVEIERNSTWYEVLKNNDKGIWVRIDQIANEADYLFDSHYQQNGFTNFRPQMIAGVTILAGKFGVNEILKLNQVSISTGADLATELGLTVQAGVMGDDGKVNTSDPAIRKYLGV